MKYRLHRTIAALGLALAAVTASAGTNYVSKAGSDATGTGVLGNPWASVTNAVAKTISGDTILVASGIYTQSVTLAGRTNLTIRGGYDNAFAFDPANQVSTIFGNGSSPIVIPAAAVSNTLSYLTLRGSSGGTTAGIQFTGSAVSTFVEGCTIVSNQYGLYSGSFVPQNIVLRNTLVIRNTADGLYFPFSNIGGGVVGGTGYILNCTFADNGGNGLRTASGGPDHGDLVVKAYNSIFAGNNGCGVWKRGTATGAVVSNCLFYANANGAVYAHTGLTQGGNKTRYPMFVNSAANNYQLQAASPAAAAGLDLSAAAFPVANDILNVARPQGSWDMGAYEGSGSGEGALLASAYVKPAGSDSTGDGSSGNPFATVTYAMGQVQASGTVYVAGGVYTERLGFGPDKLAMTVQGGYDPSTWAWDPSNQVTVLDGNGKSPVTLSPGASRNTLVALTLKRGAGGVEGGAGIEFLAPNLSVYAEGCTIVSNQYGLFGGWSIYGNAVFRNTIIARSTSHAVYYVSSGAAFGQGNFKGIATNFFYNCTVANNGGDGFQFAGNPDWNDVVPVAKNCIYASNTGYGIRKTGDGTGASCQNTVFYGNSLGSIIDLGYAGVADLGGNKTGRDPLFASVANNNYQIAATSPAAAAGTDLSAAPFSVTNDLLGGARPQGGAWDMGAYESAGAGEPALSNATYVSMLGNDTTGDGSTGFPWRTVNRALCYTAPSGTVCVASGTYTGAVWFGIDKRGITVQGGYNAAWSLDPSNQVTTLFGNGNAPVIVEGKSSGNTLQYLNLRGGTAANQAGILVNGSGADINVYECSMVSNYYGLYVSFDVRFSANMRNTLIARSTLSGIYYAYNNDVVSGRNTLGTNYLLNCTIANNGGSGYRSGSGSTDRSFITPIAKNTIFSGNNGYGLERRGNRNEGSYQNCLFHGNVSGDVYAQTGILYDLGGNKYGKDPKYVGLATNDYRLQPDSPAAGAGTNLTAFGVTNDILGGARPQGAAYDIGAYESDGPGEAQALAVAYVRTTGSDTTGNGSAGNPWATIGFAIGHTEATGTIYVAGGRYVENLSIGSDKIGAAIRGGYDASWVWNPAANPTIVDGNGNPPVAIAAGSAFNRIAYLTLVGGTGVGKAGIFYNGTASNYVFEGCTVISNTYGIYSIVPQDLTLRNTLIARSTSHAVYFQFGHYGYDTVIGTVTFQNCTVADNGGSGLTTLGINPDWSDIRAIALNTIFSGNNGYGIHRRGTAPGGVISNCLFYANTNGPLYAHNPLVIASTKTGDPRYVGAATNDYRLQSDSPAAAAGLDLTALGITNDLAGAARPQGTWDMGAFEGAGVGESARLSQVYVKTTGSDTTGDGSSGNPYATIGFALTRVATGGTVRVAAGTYRESVALGPDNRNVTVQGGYSAGWVFDPANQATVIDGAGRGPIMLNPNANSNTLSYLTLKGGTGTDLATIPFAGITLAGAGNTIFVDGCTIVSNSYGLYGYYRMTATPVFRNTLLARNTSHAIDFFLMSAMGYGTPLGTCYLYNCTVADNGGHGFITDSINPDWSDIIPVAKNSLFTGNNGYGIWKKGSVAGASFEYCLFSGNTSGATNSTGNSALVSLGNNLMADAPQYVGTEPKPYRIPEASPAFNSGTNLSAVGITADIEGLTRPQGRTYDRGAYERFVPPAGSTFLVR